MANEKSPRDRQAGDDVLAGTDDVLHPLIGDQPSLGRAFLGERSAISTRFPCRRMAW